MTLTRRAFLRAVGPGAPSPAMITARGREAWEGEFGTVETALIPPPEPDEIRINGNENPLGPGASAIQSIKDNVTFSNKYPMNSPITDRAIRGRLAKMYDDATTENIVMAPGSGEVLRNCVRAFCGPNRPLVTGELSFGSPVRTAELFDLPVKKVPNQTDLGLDLDKMAGAAIGAGLVFLCNPNNPTGTAHSKRAITDFVRFVAKESPFTYILLDEAYHDYVTAADYETGADLALRYRNVLLGRTFSKAYGMAGLRMGYAVATKETAAKIRAYKLTFGANVLGLAGIAGSLDDPDHIKQEVVRNKAVRDYTMDFFRSNGYWVSDAQTNFIFVKTGMTAKAFREGCAKHKVMVGRDFPPYEKEYARISMGTMDEMKRATEVFREVLGISATDAGSGM